MPLVGAASGADPKDKIEEFQQYRNDAEEAQGLMREGRLDEALQILDRLNKVGIASFDQQKMRGSVLLKKRRYAEAIRSFEVALAMVPHFDQLYVDIADANLALGRKDEARAAIERGLKIEPTNSLLLTAKGGVLQATGDLQGARAVLEAARTADRSDARVRVQLASVYRALGQNDRAIEELQSATQLEPDSVKAFTDYGDALAAGGRKKEAIAVFRIALKKDAHSGEALLGLARLQLPDNPDAALPLLQRLVSLDPGFPGVGDALREARAAKAAAVPARFRVIRTAARPEADEMARILASLGPSPLPEAVTALPEVALDAIEEPARAAAARLVPGQVSAVVEMPSGFAIVRRER